MGGVLWRTLPAGRQACWSLVCRGLQVLSCCNRESYWCLQHVPVWSCKAAQLYQGLPSNSRATLLAEEWEEAG